MRRDRHLVTRTPGMVGQYLDDALGPAAAAFLDHVKYPHTVRSA
jgi:hypothetical protein